MQSFIEYHRNKMIKIENATFCYGMLHQTVDKAPSCEGAFLVS